MANIRKFWIHIFRNNSLRSSASWVVFWVCGTVYAAADIRLKLTLQMTVFSLILAVVVGMVMCLFSISKVKPLNWIRVFIWAWFVGLHWWYRHSSSISVSQVRYISGLHPLVQRFWSLPECRRIPFRNFQKRYCSGQQGTDGSGEKLGLALWRCDAKNHPAAGNPYRDSFRAEPVYYHFEGYLYPFRYRLRWLMRQGQLIVSRNYQSFQTYAIVAVMYYVVVIVLTKAFQLVERRLSNKWLR